MLTSSVLLHLPKSPQQFDVAFVAFVVLRVEQDLLGIGEQARDAGLKEDTVRQNEQKGNVTDAVRGGGGESHSH